VPIFAISQQRQACCRYRPQNQILAENARKLLATNVNATPPPLIKQVLFSGSPVDVDKPHIFAQAAKTYILRFKEQVPFYFENIISAIQCLIKAYRLLALLIDC
jgi:hypothetical protein